MSCTVGRQGGGHRCDRETKARMNTFESFASVAIQSGRWWSGNEHKNRFTRGGRIKRLSMLDIGREHFGLNMGQINACMVRARKFVIQVSNSVSSDTLVKLEKRHDPEWMKRKYDAEKFEQALHEELKAA